MTDTRGASERSLKARAAGLGEAAASQLRPDTGETASENQNQTANVPPVPGRLVITASWLNDPAAQAVLKALTSGGFRAYVVGGAVRNALLGEPVDEIDIATDAPPERVIALAEQAGLKAVPTGLAHGTVTIVSSGRGFEVTTFRRDVESFGRRARVSFDAALEDDATRRDFTMNALYADATGQVFDPVGGLPDLFARRVRFVGDPDRRIKEDYLRILRFFRFFARYGAPEAPPDSKAMAAIARNAEGIERVSAERIGHEIRRLLAAPHPERAIAAMADAGVLERVLPGADPSALAFLLALEPEPGGWLRRLAALGGDDPATRLRLSRAEARRLAELAQAQQDNLSPAEAGYRLGLERGTDAVLVAAARSGKPLPEGWQEAVSRGAQASFPLKAADLLPFFEGPALGRALATAERYWIARDFVPSKAELLRHLGVFGKS